VHSLSPSKGANSAGFGSAKNWVQFVSKAFGGSLRAPSAPTFLSLGRWIFDRLVAEMGGAKDFPRRPLSLRSTKP